MIETVAKLSRAEDYFSLEEIKQVESINRGESEIRALISDQKNWYEGMQTAFNSGVSADNPDVQMMAMKWDLYASYWKREQPEIAQKVKEMETEMPSERTGVLYTPEFQAYIKKAIEILKS